MFRSALSRDGPQPICFWARARALQKPSKKSRSRSVDLKPGLPSIQPDALPEPNVH